MKSFIRVLVCLVVVVLLMTVCGCEYSGNRQVMDNIYRFDEAIIALPDGQTIRGRIESWRDFEDGDQIQIRIDGVWYLTHFSNAVLIAYPTD